MIPLNYYGVNAQQVATHPVKALKLEATLNASATAGLFLQLFDSSVAISAGAVPIKSWPAAECGFKEFEGGELIFSDGCFVALSTTKDSYTATSGGSDLMDILSVELVDPETPTGTSIAGNLTSPATELQVWSDAAGPKKLLRVDVKNTGGPKQYLLLFAKDNPANGDVPEDMIVIPANANFILGAALTFGKTGRDVGDINPANGNARKGCTLTLSSTPDVKTLSANPGRIRAEYK